MREQKLKHNELITHGIITAKMPMISRRRAEKRGPLCVVGGNVSTIITDNSVEVLQKTENRISI